MDRLDNFASAMSALGQDIASLLLPKARLNRRFVEASSHLAIESLQEWLARGADPNAHNCGRSVLQYVARSPFTEDQVVEELLKAGALPNGPSYRWKSYPLLTAAVSSTDSKIQTLLRWGADASVHWEGVPQTVLCGTILWAQMETIQQVIAAGADVNRGYWSYPLHYAVIANRPDVVALLLSHGANPSLLNREGQTPKELAYARQAEAKTLWPEPLESELREIIQLLAYLTRGGGNRER